MSADNCIAILELPDGQGGRDFFITHAQSIENITYHNPNGVPDAVWDYFGEAISTKNKQEAFDIARRIEEGYDCVEYGINHIKLPYPMSYYKAAAIAKYVEQISIIAEGNTNLVENCRMPEIARLANQILGILPEVKKPIFNI